MENWCLLVQTLGCIGEDMLCTAWSLSCAGVRTSAVSCELRVLSPSCLLLILKPALVVSGAMSTLSTMSGLGSLSTGITRMTARARDGRASGLPRPEVRGDLPIEKAAPERSRFSFRSTLGLGHKHQR